jgi:selenocysteine-specific elongation factor
VDHGKSAVVKALTGIDPDRLPEEKKRGLTIDLGFAGLSLLSRGNETVRFRVGIIDVPGHEDFIRNMVAGIGTVNAVLFVVAADDGWMPQTEEHLQILAYLGVKRAVVALTKIDLTDDGGADAVTAVRAKLASTPFAHAPIVPISVVTGIGMETLLDALAELFESEDPSRNLGRPRLHVDRAFSLRGIGTVVTGTLTGGNFRRGDAVRVQPFGAEVRIRNLQSFNEDVDCAVPGTRAAVNLPNLGVRRSIPGGAVDIGRGDVIVLPISGDPSRTLDVRLIVSPRKSRLSGTDDGSVKSGSQVRLHYGTSHALARIILYHRRQVAVGESGFAQLRLAVPMFAFAGDRFVLRSASGGATIGGGMILDAEAERRGFISEARGRFLRMRADSAQDPEPWLLSVLERDGILLRSGILARTGFSDVAIGEASSRLRLNGQTVEIGEYIACREWWRNLVKAAAEAVDAQHLNSPEQPGLSKSGLKRALPVPLSAPQIYEALVSALSKHGFQQKGIFIARVDHQPYLAERVRPAADRILAALAVSPFDPPSRKTVAADLETREALQSLVDAGKVIHLDEKAVISAEAFEQAKSVVVGLLSNRPTATVSEIRSALGSSRRIVVPLLERLDREGFTERQGDRRALRR